MTNPHQFDLDEVFFLGTSGQNIANLGNFSDAKEKLDYMERNKLLMKENAKLYRRLRILRLKLKEQTVQEAKPIRLETLVEIATSLSQKGQQKHIKLKFQDQLERQELHLRSPEVIYKCVVPGFEG